LLTLTRRHALSLRKVFSAVFRRSVQGRPIAVEFCCVNERLVLRAAGLGAAIEARLTAGRRFAPFAVSVDALKACEGKSDDPVTFERTTEGEEDQVVVRWTDRGIPQTRTFPAEELVQTFPILPETWSENGPELLTALKDAGETAEEESTRFALSCMRLRGSDGQIAATDSQQLLVQTGYQFPWEDEALVPRSKFFGSPDIPRDQPVSVGRTEDYVLFQVGDWTLWLLIEKVARFPKVEGVIPDPRAGSATVSLAEPDAQFLGPALARLPVEQDDCDRSVTVDLNGQVAIRSRENADSAVTELVLSRTEWTGEPIRFGTGREYLARAMQLGFRQLSVTAPNAPLCCRDERRVYLWMLLGGDGCVSPADNTVRIDSASAAEPVRRASRSSPRNPPMPMPRNRLPSDSSSDAGSNGVSHAESNGETRTDSNGAEHLPVLIQAERLRSALKSALDESRRLIRSLKRQRKQDRLVQSTLASLKELQTLDA
jgi:hypothetical protein